MRVSMVAIIHRAGRTFNGDEADGVSRRDTYSPLCRQARSDRPIHKKIVEAMTHRWGERAGVAQCIPHRFRHTVATTLLQAGTKIEVVQRILAHADIKDTLLYCKLADDAATSAMARLPQDWTQVRQIQTGPQDDPEPAA